MKNNNFFKGSLATSSVSTPIVAENESRSCLSLEEWIAQDLDSAGITDKYLRSQVKPIKGQWKIAQQINWDFWSGSDGWESIGVDLDGNSELGSYEFKPQTPVEFEDGKPQKYLARKRTPRRCYLPKGELFNFKAFIKPESIKQLVLKTDYEAVDWHVGRFLETFPEIPIFLTEGTKKCLCGWNQGLPTISIPGVYGWHEKDKPKVLRPMLERLFPEGGASRLAYLCFDMDSLTKKGVRTQLLKFSKELERRGHAVKICVWDIANIPSPKEGLTLKEVKGMDDFIANGGNFDEVIKTALTIAEWEKQFAEPEEKKESSRKKKPKGDDGEEPPTPVEFARQLADEYRNRWRFHDEQKSWREWNRGYWEVVPEEKIGDMIHLLAESWISTDRYVTMCQKSLVRNLRQWEWQPQTLASTAFRNGVVDINNMTIKPHAPENYNTSIIDRDWWQPEGEAIADPIEALKTYCPNIYEAWNYAMVGDERKILKLMAVCNGVLTWRFSELQKFIHLAGRPGTGKGTFSRLISALVGEGNTRASKLAKLGDDYQKAHYMDGQLVVLPDEEPTHADEPMATLKSLTGGDKIVYRQIYGEVASSPFYGTLLIISNGALFKKPQKALERRLCLVEFDAPIINRNPLAEELMMREIPQLTYCALAMNPQAVDNIIRGVGEFAIADFKAKEWELLCEESSVAAFVEDKIVPAESDEFIKQGELYQHYVTYCEMNGLKPMATNRFGSKLTEMCDFLGWKAKSVKRKTGKFFFGIDYRGDCSDRDVPLPSETFISCEKSSTGVSSSPSSPSSDNKDSDRHPHRHRR
ncbi:DUF3854 domain-containing protein [Roseofilum sp. Belize Diploria]|uniref:DUF3854 domain-containing protein n=1 Tax=Roseofilum sp. Belize Diploria TaxID=2821501 RepID=UPI001B21E6C6|nr:DUF3854 domain-containing protein [Roseofilum sp. Belize Diploria]MBP0011386.1 DUF3854 domain-containing protein [Roseofilum sp. Belize Diploria]